MNERTLCDQVIPASSPEERRNSFAFLLPLLLLALVATAVISPMLFLGNASGHDFLFHLGSWMDASGQWQEGTVYPRWAEWANWGFGEPRFIFYPPASWFVGAALGSIVSWNIAPGLFIWLTLIAAGMAMWTLSREWLCLPQALVAAVLFAVNPYNLVIVYYRSDFAELLAGALIPLMLWALLHITRGEGRYGTVLALVFAGIWLSNVPAAIIVTYSIPLLLIIACVLHRSIRPLIVGGTAMVLGWGAAAFFLLPAAWEQRWVQISQVLTSNLHPLQNFIFTQSNDPEFLLFNWKVSGVALLMMLLTGIAAVFVARKRRDFSDLWWLLLGLAIVAVLLMFRPTALLWEYLPKLRFVQFPWRWLEPLALTFAFFIAAAIDFSKRLIQSALIVSVVFAILIATGALIAQDAWWDSEGALYLENSIASAHGYEGTDEYAPVGCDRSELPGVLPSSDSVEDPEAELAKVPANPRFAIFDNDSGKVLPVKGIRLQTLRWTAETKIFDVYAAQPIVLALRLISYPAWEVRIDGESAQYSSQETTARMLVPVPVGKHRFEVRFRRTADRIAGDVISLLSVCLLSLLGAISRSRKDLRAGAHPLP